MNNSVVEGEVHELPNAFACAVSEDKHVLEVSLILNVRLGDVIAVLTPIDPKQDEINEIIGLTERKIRDLMNLFILIVFNKIIDKTSGHFEAFFPCQNRLFFFGKTGDFCCNINGLRV